MSTLTQSLRSFAVQEVVSDRRARSLVGILAFAFATAFGAQVAVPLPFTPVPVTLQPMFVILAGLALGARRGAAAVALYVAVGAAGAPVFSNGAAGIPWLLGPTGGYLLAMPAAAFVSGTVAGRDGGSVRMIAGLVAGVATIYAGGVSQLVVLTGQSFASAVTLGVAPFLAGDVAKVVLAFGAAQLLRRTSFDRF